MNQSLHEVLRELNSGLNSTTASTTEEFVAPWPHDLVRLMSESSNLEPLFAFIIGFILFDRIPGLCARFDEEYQLKLGMYLNAAKDAVSLVAAFGYASVLPEYQQALAILIRIFACLFVAYSSGVYVLTLHASDESETA